MRSEAVFTPVEYVGGVDYVERYVLLDQAGAVRDVATLSWPSRRRFQIVSARRFGNPSEGFLEICAPTARDGPERSPVATVELGAEAGPLKKVDLVWTGTRRLGLVWIDGGRFKAKPVKE